MGISHITGEALRLRSGKQEFIKTVPLDMLVLETDSLLNPEPNRSKEGGTKMNRKTFQ